MICEKFTIDKFHPDNNGMVTLIYANESGRK